MSLSLTTLAQVISVITAASPSDIIYAKGLAESVLGQTGVPFEWVIQEDGPTAVWRSVSADERVSYANSPKPAGPAVARNLAIARAEGDIVRNVDADDELTPDILSHTGDVLEAHPEVDYVVGPMIDVLEDGSEQTFEEVLDPGPIEPGTLFQWWLDRDHFGAVHPTCLAIRRSVLIRSGGYSALPVSEDTALLLAVSQASMGWFADRPVARHRKRSGSITAQPWSKDPRATDTRYDFIKARCELLGQTLI